MNLTRHPNRYGPGFYRHVLAIMFFSYQDNLIWNNHG